MIGVNGQWYRCSSGEWNIEQQKWFVKLNDESVYQPAVLNVPIDQCQARFNIDWYLFNDKWIMNSNSIPQFDGTFVDGQNSGEIIRGLVKHLPINEPLIEQEKNYIAEYGIDTTGYIKHARFNANGFAMKANL